MMSTFSEDLLHSCRKLHFIGIGGSGMFPIVQILHAQGYEISGSDNTRATPSIRNARWESV